MTKVALVTGGAQGIGQAIARRLADDGFAVAVSLLSTQSEGFGTPAVSDCYSFVKATFAHWQKSRKNITTTIEVPLYFR